MEYEANRRVETSARTFAIVERLSRTDRVGVSTLAADLELSKGIVHNHLSTLRELGFVTKGAGGYALSPKLLSVGLRSRSNTRLYQVANAPLEGLADRMDVGVVCCREAGSECIVIDAYNVSRRQYLDVGATLPLRESLPGLVLCVASERELSVGTSEYDVDRIRSELATSRYAVGPVSTDAPETCVTVPVLDEDGECHGSLGAVVPEDRDQQQLERVAEATVSVRDRVETRFQSEWSGERSFTTEKHAWIN